VDERVHPMWCDPAGCTAFAGGDVRQVHRTAPIRVPTEDGDTGIYVHANVGPDGAALSIEVSELKEPLTTDFYLAETSQHAFRGELVLAMPEARALASAITAAQHQVAAEPT
jgi:hypothetical protein